MKDISIEDVGEVVDIQDDGMDGKYRVVMLVAVTGSTERLVLFERASLDGWEQNGIPTCRWESQARELLKVFMKGA